MKFLIIIFCFVMTACQDVNTERENSPESEKFEDNLVKLRQYGTRGLGVAKKSETAQVKLMALRKGEDYSSVFEVKSTDILKAGDLLQYHLNLTETVYLYVLLLDSSGEISALHPSLDTGYKNPVKPGKLKIPENKRMWFLDSSKGHETFFLVTSKKPIEEIEKIIKKLKSERLKITSRGVGGVTKAEKDFVLTIDNLINSSQIKKHIKTFIHQ